jgi:predicted NAD-dependent protein-ADP-ribosyltransferase YbiA (DUF1768 family)
VIKTADSQVKMRDIHVKTIKFYRVQDAFGCFSNFASCPIELDGKVWPTSEDYFQALALSA